MPHWQDGTLAFVHACGSPDPTRSHFDAQDFMESGTPGRKSTGDGWMNRVLAALPGFHGPTEAVSLGATVPRILSGRMAVANIQLGRAAARPLPLDNPTNRRRFRSALHWRRPTQPRPFAKAGRAQTAARRTPAGYDRGRCGAPPPNGSRTIPAAWPA